MRKELLCVGNSKVSYLFRGLFGRKDVEAAQVLGYTWKEEMVMRGYPLRAERRRARKGDPMLTGQILLQLIVILIVVQLFGHLSGRIGQQWVMGEILAGIALGPSLLGAFFPGIKAMVFPASALPTLQTLGDIGLVFYMFSLGSRLDTPVILRQSRKAIVASFSGILLPLILGASLAFALYPAFAGPKATHLPSYLLFEPPLPSQPFPVLPRCLPDNKS